MILCWLWLWLSPTPSDTWQWRDAPLAAVAVELAEAAEANLVFDPNLVQDVLIRGNFHRQSPAAILEQLLAQTALQLQQPSNERWVIVPAADQSHQTIRGALISAEGPMRGQVVRVLDSHRVAVSDNNGIFSLPRLPTRTWQLAVDADGYLPAVTTHRLQSTDAEIAIFLTNEPLFAEQLTVAQQLPEVAAADFTARRTTPEAIMQRGTTSGDLFKGLEALPGIAAGFAEGGVSIRAASPAENLVRLDGIQLYQLDHAMGHFSALNPDAVQSITVYKGAFPARYGNRTAGVLDIDTKGDRLGVRDYRLGLDRDMANLTALQPLGERASLLVSARQSISDTTSSAVAERLFATTFNDFQNDFQDQDAVSVRRGFDFEDHTARFTWRPTGKDTFTITAFRGRDFTNENIDVAIFQRQVGYLDKAGQWGNDGTSLRWHHGDRWQISWSRSRFESAFETEALPNDAFERALRQFFETGQPLQLPDPNRIARDTFLEEDSYDLSYTFRPETRQEVLVGVFATRMDFAFTERLATQVTDHNGWDTEQRGLFLEHHGTWSRNWETMLGFRGGSNRATNSDYLEPRLAVSYRQANGGSWRLSAARSHQFVLRSPDTINFFEGTPAWFLALADVITAGKATHWQLGYRREFGAWRWDTEAYYRLHAGSLIKLFDPLINRFTLGQTAERYRGLELRLARQWGPYLLSMAYAYQNSQVVRDLTRNTPLDYPSDRERPQTLHLALTWQQGPWQAASIIRAASGTPTDVPRVVRVQDPDGNHRLELAAPTVRNTDRLPDIFNWDARLFRTFRINKAQLQLGLGITNITDHDNVTDRFYVIENDRGTVSPVDVRDFGRRINADLQIRF